jgi:hypothetical protein
LQPFSGNSLAQKRISLHPFAREKSEKIEKIEKIEKRKKSEKKGKRKKGIRKAQITTI